MNELVKIIDFGNSEYRLGYGGEISASEKKTPLKKKNLSEFENFLSSKLPKNKKNIILIEKNIKNREERKKLIEICFEKLDCENLFLAKSGIMSLYSIGKSSGFVIENSESSLEMVCVEDSFIDQKFTKQSKINFLEFFKENLKKYKNLDLNEFRGFFKNKGINNKIILPDGSEIDFYPFIDEGLKMVDDFFTEKIYTTSEILFTGRVFNNKMFKEVFINHLQDKKNTFLNIWNIDNFFDNSNFIGASILSQVKSIDDFYINRKTYKEKGFGYLENLFF